MQTEVNTLLQNAGNVINLEIAFEAPPGKLAIAVIETFVPSLLVSIKCTVVVKMLVMFTGSSMVLCW